MDRDRSGSSGVCAARCKRKIGEAFVLFRKINLDDHKIKLPFVSAHPLILVGVFESQVVGEGSHSDGQLAYLLQLYRPLMGSDNERIHPPIRCLEM